MLVREYYMDCLFYEEKVLSHYIHHLLQEGKIELDDDAEKIDFEQADHEKVREMVDKNVLGFRKIRAFSLKIDSQNYVFIFAENEQDAIQYFAKVFKKPPLNCHEYILDFEVIRGNEIISFRDMRKEHEQFPAIAGFFSKNDYRNEITRGRVI